MSQVHKGPETAGLARRIAVGLRLFAAVMIVGILASLVNVKVGILCFVLTPIIHFYGYLRDPLRTGEPSSAPNDSR